MVFNINLMQPALLPTIAHMILLPALANGPLVTPGVLRQILGL